MRRILAFFLCLTLLLPLLAASVKIYAADSYLITIAEDTVLQEVGNDQMAVYIDGIIYIPYTTIREMKSVYVNYNKEEQMVTVFAVGADMCFELDTGLTYDRVQQRSIRVSAKMRGEVPYLPVSIVAAWMGMYFSFTSAADSGVGYPVIRLASDQPALSDRTILARNSTRLRSVARARDKASGIVTPLTPEELPQRTVSLLFTGLPDPAAEEPIELPTLLDTLESYGVRGAFFLPESELLTRAEDLRQLYCRGHAPGIWLTDVHAPVAQARRCSELYAQLLHIRVRTVCAYGIELTEDQKKLLAENGFVLWQPTFDPYGDKLTANKLNTAARKALRDAPPSSSLRLQPDDLTLDALPMLYSYLVAQNFKVAPVNEWTTPY